MKVFGISKGMIQRAVVKFDAPPEKQPMIVCFHFPSTFLTHRYVLDMVRQQLKAVEGARVKTIQFVDRNTIHGTRVCACVNISSKFYSVLDYFICTFFLISFPRVLDMSQ